MLTSPLYNPEGCPYEILRPGRRPEDLQMQKSSVIKTALVYIFEKARSVRKELEAYSSTGHLT